jgi:hypothetical protein
VSSTLGLWLIAQGYARPEMRQDAGRELTSGGEQNRATSDDTRQRRRQTDRPKTRS